MTEGLHMNRCEKNPNKIIIEQVLTQEGAGAVKSTYDDGKQLVVVKSAFGGKVATYRLGFDNSPDDLLYRLQEVLNNQVFNLLEDISNTDSWKYYISLKMIFHKSSSIGELTDPPVVLNSEPLLLQPTTNVKTQLETVHQNLTHQISEFGEQGSGWVIDHFNTLDVNTAIFSFEEDDSDSDDE